MIRLALQLLGLAVLLLATARAGSALFDAALNELDLPAVARPHGTAGAVDQALDYKPPPSTAFAQTLARPVFFEGRRFPQPEGSADKVATAIVAQPPPAPPPSTEKLKLRGVLLEADLPKALIENSSGGIESLSVGQLIEQWSIIKIEPSRVQLRSRGRTSVLDLYSVPADN